VVIADCTITENREGGIVVDGGATITNCTIAGNGASYHDGGGVYCSDGSTIANCTITGNHSADSGGGLYCRGGTTITNCAITGNTAEGVGGGLYCRDGAIITDCAITSNVAMWAAGGWFVDSAHVAITDCTISGNTSGGGVCYSGDGDLVLANCTISDNTTTLCSGGVYYEGSGSLMVSNCTIERNIATSTVPFPGVGGVDCQGEGTFVSSTISGNIGSDVGGIYGINPRVVNCEITANEGYSGGGLMCYDGAAIANCTITGNTAVDEGGGVLLIRGNPSIANSILWANSAPQGPDISVGGGYSYVTTLSVTHSDVQGGQQAVHVDEGCTLIWGPGNIDADPLFVDPDGPDDDPNTFEDNDYRLSAGSPCIDAADNTAVPADTLDLDGDGDTEEPIPFDLDGNPRFVDDPDTDDTGNGTPPIVDMGAYEFQVGIVGYLDIKPGSCPNPLNRNSHGVLPVAIVGSADFDVTQIDVDTLVLTRADGVGGGVTPLMGPPGPGIRVEDVATPFEGEPCDCHELGSDGIDDLSMKFNTETLVAELELDDLPGGAMVELIVSGALSDGTPFSAADCIRLVPAGSGPESRSRASAVGDGGRNVPHGHRQPASHRGHSARDSSGKDADSGGLALSAASESDDADAAHDEDSQRAFCGPLVACGPLSPALLLTMVAGTCSVRCRRP